MKSRRSDANVLYFFWNASNHESAKHRLIQGLNQDFLRSKNKKSGHKRHIGEVNWASF